MGNVWKLLRFVPGGLLGFAKRSTSSKFRLWVRENFGGSHKSIPDKVVTLSDGRKIHIGPDYIYWPIHLGLDFEPEATSVVRRVVQPGDTVLDIGANYGWYTTLFAQLVGDTGHVHAFEPVPSTFERLTEHLQINHFLDRVFSNRSAVGENVGEIDIHVFEELSHSRSSISILDQDRFTSFKAPITDVDAYLETHSTTKVDFLKCDVEGSELMVLKGAQQLLQSTEAPVVLIELNDETSEAFGYTTSDIESYLREMGYDHFYGIDKVDEVRRVVTQEDIVKLPILLCAKGDRIEARMASSHVLGKAA